MNEPSARQVVIGATFTAEPIEPVLTYWNESLGWQAELVFAPYNQLSQNVLDPSSPMRTNQQGANLVLLRLSDWAVEGARSEDGVERLWDRASEWLDALAAAQGSATYVLVFCPPPPDSAGPRAAEVVEQSRQVERRMRERLASLLHVQVLGTDDLAERYPVADYADSHADALGHIPYTEPMYAAIATAAARRIDCLWRPAYKVLALDCDETLWSGVVGEDGPEGIELSDERLALQRMARSLRESGMLLCLCSKNELADVEQVFDSRVDMLLGRDQLTLLKVNWESKSDNLQAIARELNLGLDSIIFLDDNPVELGEVRARCPEVLALQVPSGEGLASLPRWLQHMWAFDTLRVTEADRRRAEMYAENLAREQAAQQAPSLSAFLRSLELDIRVEPVGAADVPRASQLTQRTNQFNFTTVRRDEAAVQALLDDPSYQVLQVRLSDRYGDYGVVGLGIGHADIAAKEMRVDTLLLSCRALGRGVEHALVACLAEHASERGLVALRFDHLRTAKNLPALKFLRGLAGDALTMDGDRHSASLSSRDLQSLRYDPDTQHMAGEGEEAAPVSGGSRDGGSRDGGSRDGGSRGIDATAAADRYARIALQLYDVERILAAIGPAAPRQVWPPKGERVPPDGDLEQAVAESFAEVLAVDAGAVGATDDFFAIGGNSLLATRVLSRLREDFEVNVTLKEFFAGPNVRALASSVEAMILDELEALDDP